MTTEATLKARPFVIKALVAIQGKHPQQLSVLVRGRIDCPRCRSTLNYVLNPDRTASGNCTAARCISL